MTNHTTSKPPTQRILILGGGFGGVYAALHLEKLLARKRDVELCLVSRDNFFLFTPMLHEIAASDLEITNIVNPLRKLLRRTEVLVGDVEQIDLPNQRVLISHGYGNHSHALRYDHLVLALGSVTNFFNLPGLAELALAMKSLPDAIQLRAQIIGHLEEANSERILTDRQSLLTFVVAGGGFAGVETVAALNDFVREALRYYPNLRQEMLRVVLVHSGAVILPELGESLGRCAQKALVRRGVEIRLNTRVTSMTENEVFVTGSVPMPASTLVWTAGTVPNPLVSSLPCQKERGGRVLVNEFLQVPEWPGVWAVGDCGLVPDTRRPGKSHPPTAQHAIREGRVVAQNIAASLYCRPLKPFSFKTIGLLASIGRRRGVARIFGFNFSGFFAWWLWRTIYLSKLPGLDKKVRVAFEWTLDLLFRKDVCAVHHQPRRSDCYREEQHENTFGSNGNGRPTPSADTSSGKQIHSKKESVREYSAPISGQEQWAS
ncbi:MAG TPA: NAD(P)/FAD-dependent oxidoreductase [Candidatus Binatia bacterium]|nr:NAD(P)/FAD-dependent oxidoreductase [Candidatus Binatia bacterium]